MTPDIIAALEAFAAYADPRRSVPASMPVTSGSSMARKQLTMGDCYAAADALAALSTSPAGQEVPTKLRSDIAFLSRLVDADIEREGEMASTMVRAGLLRDILAALSSVEPAAEQEAVAWVSPGQFAAHEDQPPGVGGNYLPVRKSRDGNFTMPLYATPPAPALDGVRAACEGIDDDYMTSEAHHPGYVLIPTAKFEAIRNALSSPSEGESATVSREGEP